MGSEAKEEVTIRPATEADWPAIWSMFQAVASAGDAFAYDENTPESVARHLWFDPPSRAYVAELASEIVGTYFIRPNQPGRGKHVANAGYIVGPQARGKGLAVAMCIHSLDVARQLGYRAMQFNYVVSSNTGAVRAWEKCGFEIVGRLPSAFQHRELGSVDVFVMYRQLARDDSGSTCERVASTSRALPVP